MMERIPADELDAWRHHHVTEALVKEIRTSRAAAVEALAGEARGAPEHSLRVWGGRVAALDAILRIINTKGAPE